MYLINFFKEKDIPKLQAEFISKIEKELIFCKTDVTRKSEHQIVLTVQPKEKI